MKTILNPGTYWIGDPCYAFPEPDQESDPWYNFLQQTGFFQYSSYYKDYQLEIWADFVDKGAGDYLSSSIEIFPVESSLLGIISDSSLNSLESNRDKLEVLGMFITFHEPFEVFKEDGTFHFGPIDIYTSSDENFIPAKLKEDNE